LRKSEKIEQSKELEMTTTETPPSAETSQAIAALTNSETITPQDMEDVTVTITIKKDKNKKLLPPSQTLQTKDEKESGEEVR
jgi:hypothetical protein